MRDSWCLLPEALLAGHDRAIAAPHRGLAQHAGQQARGNRSVGIATLLGPALVRALGGARGRHGVGGTKAVAPAVTGTLPALLREWDL